MVKIIEPSYEILKIDPNNPLKLIEYASRHCYQSFDYIKEGSDVRLVKMLLEQTPPHTAMIEHSNVIIEVIDPDIYKSIIYNLTHNVDRICINGIFLRCTSYSDRCIISGNLRAFYEFIKRTIPTGNNYSTFELLQFIRQFAPVIFDEFCGADTFNEFELLHPKDLTNEEKEIHCVESVRFVTNRACSHQMVRNRASYAQESQRYVDYTKNKFGAELKIIRPIWASELSIETCQKMVEFAEKYGLGYPNLLKDYFDLDEDLLRDDVENNCFAWINEKYEIYDKLYKWCYGKIQSEKQYNLMRSMGLKAEDARDDLPNATKTEIVCTATLSHWKHIFSLRTDGHAQHLIRHLMSGVQKDLIKKYPEIFGENKNES